jgi:hypothetical protein
MPNNRVSVCLRTAFDLRGLSHTPPTVRGPDLGHLTDLCPRVLSGFAVNAEDERPDNPELLQALLDWANRARRGAVVFSVCVSCLRPVLGVDLTASPMQKSGWMIWASFGFSCTFGPSSILFANPRNNPLASMIAA